MQLPEKIMMNNIASNTRQIHFQIGGDRYNKVLILEDKIKAFEIEQFGSTLMIGASVKLYLHKMRMILQSTYRNRQRLYIEGNIT